MEPKVRLTRTAAPSMLDEAPYASVCTVYKDKGNCELYVQRSKDETVPKWDLLGEFDEEKTEETINKLLTQ